MPPRYVYWTILAGGLPTAFRAAEKDELLPTFKRIQETQPDAQMKFFARGKLWDSPEQALRAEDHDSRTTERRGRDWRPGGEHRDPRQPFKDAKKARNQDRRKDRWDRKQQQEAPRERPHGDPMRKEVPAERRARKPQQDWKDRPPRQDWRDRPPQQDWRSRPPRQDWRDRPPREDWRERRSNKPGTDRPRDARGRGGFDRPQGRPFDKPQGRPFDKPQGRPYDKPKGGRPFDKAQGRPFDKAQGRRFDKPRPHGDKLGDRPFTPKSEHRFDRRRERNDENPPSRPPGPNREPRPGKEPSPDPPPRPSEPAVRPPGPPERGSNAGGRLSKRKRER